MAQAHADAEKYYVPHSSPWPIYGSITLFVLMSGAVATLNDWLPVWALLPGFVMLALLFILWFHTVIGENQKGMYNLAMNHIIPMRNDVVHLFRSDVLCRILRRLVLCAQSGR